MTDAAFDILTKSLVKGGSLQVIKDYPNWFALMTGDGFRSHKMTLQAQVDLFDAKILHQIEEEDTSHCNQPLDRNVARVGKGIAKHTLAKVIQHQLFRSDNIDQWGLVVIAMYVCKILAETPDIWRQSFIATNSSFIDDSYTLGIRSH